MGCSVLKVERRPNEKKEGKVDKRIRECRRCGAGDVIDRVDPRYGSYSQCIQCGHEEVGPDENKTAATPRETRTIRVNRGRALPALSPIRIWQGQV